MFFSIVSFYVFGMNVDVSGAADTLQESMRLDEVVEEPDLGGGSALLLLAQGAHPALLGHTGAASEAALRGSQGRAGAV